VFRGQQSATQRSLLQRDVSDEDQETPRVVKHLGETSSVLPVSGWLGSRVGSVLDSGAEGPGFKSQSRRCRITV